MYTDHDFFIYHLDADAIQLHIIIRIRDISRLHRRCHIPKVTRRDLRPQSRVNHRVLEFTAVRLWRKLGKRRLGNSLQVLAVRWSALDAVA